MLDLRLLKTFIAVAVGPSFRKAADALHLAPSTVTAQVKALEDELGKPLFDRVGRRVLLTESGERLLDHARRLVELEAETRRYVDGAGDASGELVVRLSESLGIHCLPCVLPRFRERCPATRLTLATAARQGMAQDLRHGATDLALLLGEPFAAPDLTVEELGRERLAVIAPPASPLAGLAAVRPSDLGGMALILTRHVWSVRALIERALAREHVGTTGLVECTSAEIVKRCVMAGQGVSVVPAFTVREEVRQGRLAMLDWADGPLLAPVLLLRHASRWLSPAASEFCDCLRAFFAASCRSGAADRTNDMADNDAERRSNENTHRTSCTNSASFPP